MATLDSFLSRVEPHVPGATVPAMHQSILDAAIEFCDRTNVIDQVARLGTTANQPLVSLPLPAQTALASVRRVTYKDTLLELAPMGDVADGSALGVADPVTGSPRSVFIEDHDTGTLTLYPRPERTEANVLAVRFSIRPTRAATDIPDALFEDWAEFIAAGAVCRLMKTPDKPFSNAQLAGLHAGMFETGVGRATNFAARGRSMVSRRVRLRPFA